MDLKAFTRSLDYGEPPREVSAYLRALWYDAKGDWKKAHEIVQDLEDENAAWIHAYLHRKEGDSGNAMYWYHRAGKKMPSQSLNEEWTKLVQEFL